MTNSAGGGFGILAAGAYIPHLRLDRGEIAAAHRWMAPGLKSLAKGGRAMASWDEDVITMAVEAGRATYAGLPGRRTRTSSLLLGSTTLPFADRLNASVVAATLDIPLAVSASDCAGSLRAATSALLRALRDPARGDVMVIGADHRIPSPASPAEMLAGDGACAVLVGHGEPLAVPLAAVSETRDFVDHFRASGRNADYAWEERWVRDEGLLSLVPGVIARALAEAGVSPGEVSAFLMPAPIPKVQAAVARKAGIRPEAVADALFENCGDTGCGHALLMLARELVKGVAGRVLVLVQFGSGCDAIVLRTTGKAGGQSAVAAISGSAVETSYLKYLSFTGQFQPEWGMRAEMDNRTALSAAWRGHDMVAGFTGGRCSRCGTVQFPAGRVCVNPGCGAVDAQEPARLCDEPAHIRSYTSDWLTWRPSPPFMFGHVEFTNGARVLMEYVDCVPAELGVGTPLRMVFRIKDNDPARGFRRYFWKATVRRTAGEV